ncbi:MAG: hypothetical protein KBT54_05125 [Amphritea sp.]|nr:hypothetical protein [Amphritea sp.]
MLTLFPKAISFLGDCCGGTVALGLRRLGYAMILITESGSALIIEDFRYQALNQVHTAGFCFTQLTIVPGTKELPNR